jgi:hypothetical protein
MMPNDDATYSLVLIRSERGPVLATPVQIDRLRRRVTVDLHYPRERRHAAITGLACRVLLPLDFIRDALGGGETASAV